MNKKKYKLTISILASNRKDTLPKTLESLKPILDNVSSELIVVDTGCDEDLLEIVRHRLQCFQKGEFPSRESACALTHIEEALMWLNKRKEDRKARNVLGKNLK